MRIGRKRIGSHDRETWNGTEPRKISIDLIGLTRRVTPIFHLPPKWQVNLGFEPLTTLRSDKCLLYFASAIWGSAEPIRTWIEHPLRLAVLYDCSFHSLAHSRQEAIHKKPQLIVFRPLFYSLYPMKCTSLVPMKHRIAEMVKTSCLTKGITPPYYSVGKSFSDGQLLTTICSQQPTDGWRGRGWLKSAPPSFSNQTNGRFVYANGCTFSFVHRKNVMQSMDDFKRFTFCEKIFSRSTSERTDYGRTEFQYFDFR